LVVVDPQNDFLSPAGASWALFGESILENNTVSNIGRLFKVSKAAGPRLPEGDGYLAAIINYRFLAHALWTTEHTVEQLSR
jgi:hypothetical protein